MKYLKFYDQENLRHPELYGVVISKRYTQIALNHFSKKYLPGHKPRLSHAKDKTGNISLANRNHIHLAWECDWLTFLHEFAHVIEFRRYGDSFHRPRLARLIDVLCQETLAMGWVVRDLTHQLDTFEASFAELEAHG